MSPNSQDEFSSSYDMNSHIKRKELFTQRKQREFIPDNKKDDSYWDRRRRNNEAAKRSREKRRYNDMVSISFHRIVGRHRMIKSACNCQIMMASVL